VLHREALPQSGLVLCDPTQADHGSRTNMLTTHDFVTAHRESAMISEAIVIALGLLGLKWMLPPESYTDSNSHRIRQGNGVKPSPTPAVLQPSTTIKPSALQKVRMQLLHKLALYASYTLMISV
jgi:hypothetical protein